MNPLDLLATEINVPREVQTFLVGKVIDLPRATVTFPADLVVTGGVHELTFHPPAIVKSKGPFGLTLHVSGAKVGLDGVTLVIDRFPDLNVKLSW